jgi:hypothetical protein
MAQATGRSAPEGTQSVHCKACGRDLTSPGSIGWECECGIVVCSHDECTNEYFRFIADGEATRCLACGAIL